MADDAEEEEGDASGTSSVEEIERNQSRMILLSSQRRRELGLTALISSSPSVERMLPTMTRSAIICMQSFWKSTTTNLSRLRDYPNAVSRDETVEFAALLTSSHWWRMQY
jgi:hypothetical protein